VNEVAFTPKASYRDLDSLGAVFVNDTTEVNVRELVAASTDGTFVVTDPAVIATLDRYPAVRRAAVPDTAPAPEDVPSGGAPASTLDQLTKRELLALPEADGIEGASRMNVEELRAAITSGRGDA
jgi:hypothetical protein